MKKLAFLLGVFSILLIFIGTARALGYECIPIGSCTPCSNFHNYTACSSDSGCYWVNCPSYTNEQDCNYYGCTWNVDYCEGTYYCEGTCTNCDTHGSNSSCIAQSGCSWYYTGTAYEFIWNTPINNSFTQNQSWIYWNISVWANVSTCFLSLNGTSNITMSIFKPSVDYNYCYFNSTTLTNATAYCGVVWANDTFGDGFGNSGTECATINLTLAAPPPSILNLTFVSPTPANNTLQSSRSFTANVSGSEALDTCTLTVNGTYNYSMVVIGDYAYYTVSNLNDGTHTYYATCNGSVTNTTETRTLRIDGTAPTITIYSPQNTSYTTTSIALQVSSSESIDTWWYSLNDGANATFTPNTTISAIQGSNNITVYANDSAGNTGSSSVFFFVDSIPPSITWNTPTNNSYTQNSSEIDWNVSLSEAPDTCIISMNGSNATMTIDGLYCYYNILNLTNATTYCSVVYANDSLGNMNVSGRQCATINLTSIAPSLTIIWNTPANNSFTLNLSSILWNATISESPDTCILNINNSANYSMLISGLYCYYTTSNLTNQTTYCGVIYANDSASNESSEQCATINLTSAAPPAPPTPSGRITQIVPAPFGSLAGLALGAGLIFFMIGTFFSFRPEDLIRDPKVFVVAGIAVVIVAIIVAAVI
jgi:hypothetical protein